jgi:hypothetical protein
MTRELVRATFLASSRQVLLLRRESGASCSVGNVYGVQLTYRFIQSAISQE